ncbi:hypothetical protein ACFL1V_06115 [Pseudomonadota bacterium]
MTRFTLIQSGRSILTALVLTLLLSACAQTSVVDSWKTDQPVTNKPTKVAVIAVLPEALMRKAVEIDIAKVLLDKGTPAVPASNLPGMSGGIRGEIDSEVAAEILRSAGVDGVVVLFYSGGANSEGYVRSDYWAQHVGSGMGYSWGRPYFTNVYTVRQGPGWADYSMSALVESTFYDLETDQPVWRIVTETKDTEHADTADDIARQIASEMRSAGLN